MCVRVYVCVCVCIYIYICKDLDGEKNTMVATVCYTVMHGPYTHTTLRTLNFIDTP